MIRSGYPRLAAWFFLLVMTPLLALSAAHAAPVHADLEWQAPATRADGTPLQAGELAEYRVYWSVDSAIDATAAPVVVSGRVTELVTIELTPRAEPYTLRFAVTAVDNDGRESDLSNIVTHTVKVASTASPTPPTFLRLEISCGSGCVIQPAE